jgi:hypothetical protein
LVSADADDANSRPSLTRCNRKNGVVRSHR